QPVVEALLRERDEALHRLRGVLRIELDPDLAALLHGDHCDRMHSLLPFCAARDARERRHESRENEPSPHPHAGLLFSRRSAGHSTPWQRGAMATPGRRRKRCGAERRSGRLRGTPPTACPLKTGATARVLRARLTAVVILALALLAASLEARA